MITERHYIEELRNIIANAPVFPGDLVSHATAKECEQRGWITRDTNGNWIPTGVGLLQPAALSLVSLPSKRQWRD